jgi:hypothetical protein
VPGTCFSLYLILDDYSRQIVGGTVYPEASVEHTARVCRKTHRREGVRADARVLHADNGALMQMASLLVTLQRLGVVPSFSRTAVGHDNPYSASLCKTRKGRPSYPEKTFETPGSAHAWVDTLSTGKTTNTSSPHGNSSPQRNAIAAKTPSCSASAKPSTQPREQIIRPDGPPQPSTGNRRTRSSSLQGEPQPRSTKRNLLQHD